MRNVKMADIAEACGVSIKSVSRVLNNNQCERRNAGESDEYD